MLMRFKDFDLYRKIPKDLTESSSVSAILSLFAALFMLALFVAELWAFLTIHYQTNIIIDPNTDSLLRVNFNITLVDMPCEYASIDVVDALGTRNDNVTVNINKWQVDARGVRRNYEGRNVAQADILHDVHHDLGLLQANGVHATPVDGPSFDGWLSHHEYTFVNFYAPWCVWCQRLHPVWEAFAERAIVDNIPVSVVQVDCVENRDLCMDQKIQAFPMLRVFKHGVVSAAAVLLVSFVFSLSLLVKCSRSDVCDCDCDRNRPNPPTTEVTAQCRLSWSTSMVCCRRTTSCLSCLPKTTQLISREKRPSETTTRDA
jgi:thiol-disulfide isomerase/thioredoxin